MEPRPDIAVFLSSFAGGGAERVILQLCERFYERGLLIDLIIVNDTGSLRPLVPEGVRLIKLNCNKPSKAILKLNKYLKKNKPHSLFSALTHANIACVIAHQISRFSCRVVLSERTDITHDLLNRSSLLDVFLTKILIRLLYPRADKIITVSKGASESIKEISGINTDKIKTIYNPIDIHRIYKLSHENVSLPWKDQLPIIITSGRLTISKDFPCILKAFSIMKKRFPSHLVILGEGEQRQTLNQIIEELEIKIDVWLPGYCQNPYSYMAQSSLYVLPSRLEGLPNVLIEALALGIPIVSTNCPSGPEEILENGKYGRLVPVGDPLSMAEAMEKSLSGDNPVFDKEEALQRFQPELIIDQYLEALGFSGLQENTSPAL